MNIYLFANQNRRSSKVVFVLPKTTPKIATDTMLLNVEKRVTGLNQSFQNTECLITVINTIIEENKSFKKITVYLQIMGTEGLRFSSLVIAHTVVEYVFKNCKEIIEAAKAVPLNACFPQEEVEGISLISPEGDLHSLFGAVYSKTKKVIKSQYSKIRINPSLNAENLILTLALIEFFGCFNLYYLYYFSIGEYLKKNADKIQEYGDLKGFYPNKEREMLWEFLYQTLNNLTPLSDKSLLPYLTELYGNIFFSNLKGGFTVEMSLEKIEEMKRFLYEDSFANLISELIVTLKDFEMDALFSVLGKNNNSAQSESDKLQIILRSLSKSVCLSAWSPKITTLIENGTLNSEAIVTSSAKTFFPIIISDGDSNSAFTVESGVSTQEFTGVTPAKEALIKQAFSFWLPILEKEYNTYPLS